ncbi:hypothetical protein ABIA30_001799 [Mycobacterium sp. MAA66]|uniref:hypothetical protein n=1 Tax=Mycobacterium sp. MAA66 TaxID=3156297 RepID=UPI0035126FBD
MGTLLLRPLRLWVRYLPQLAACYLLGQLGRTAAIELAARFGAHNALWADVIMPFAGFARLASFIAMFLVLRPAIPALNALPRTNARNVDLFSNVVMPFIAIYIGWQLLRDDWVAFAQTSLYYLDLNSAPDQITELNPSDIPVSNVAWALIIGAFVLQHLLKWFQNRTPEWFVGIRLYLQVFWVFLTVSFAANQGAVFLLKPAVWFQQRRLVVWFDNATEQANNSHPAVKAGTSVIGAVWHAVVGVAGMPLLWLVIAGLVYGVSAAASWRGVARQLAGDRAAAVVDRAAPAQVLLQQHFEAHLGARSQGLAKRAWESIKAQVKAFFGKYATILNSARPILHGGFVPIAVYVLAFAGTAWLSVTDTFYRMQIESGYLVRFFAWAIGWHDDAFWSGPGSLAFTLSDTLVTALRICLVASTYAYCAEKIEAEQAANPQTDEAAEAVTA